MLFLEDQQTFKIHKYTRDMLPSLLIGEGLTIQPIFRGKVLGLNGEYPRRVNIGEPIAEDENISLLSPVNGIAKVEKDYISQISTVKLFIDGKLVQNNPFNNFEFDFNTLKEKLFQSGITSLDFENSSIISMLNNLKRDRESFIVFSPFTRENLVDFKDRIFQNYSSELAQFKKNLSMIFPEVNTIDFMTNKNIPFQYPDGEPRYFLHKYCGFDISQKLEENRIVYFGPETIYYLLKALYYDTPFFEREVPIIIIDARGNMIGGSGVFNIKNGLNLKEYFKTIKGNFKYFTINSFYKKNPIFNLEEDFIFDIYNHSCIIICKSKINEQTETNCIECDDCSHYCPVQANPRALIDNNYQEFKKDICIECGICSVFCPSHINLEQKIQDAKRGGSYGGT